MSNDLISPARVREVRDMMLQYLYAAGGDGKLKEEISIDEIKKALNLSQEEYLAAYNNLQSRRLLKWPATFNCIGINLEGQFEVETLGPADAIAQGPGNQTDGLVAQLRAMSKLMAGQSAAKDKILAEFDAYRSRPWWRRIAG